ncbi:IPT/TIG domain-containing protein [Chloroflexota bacterium]
MKYIKPLRVLVIALTFALLAAAVPATPALAAGDLMLSPTSGKVGDEFEAYGSGFEPDDIVRFYFSDEFASVGEDIDTDVLNYEYLGGGNTGTGSFQGNYFYVPAELTSGVDETVRGGTYYVYVADYYKNILASAQFTVESVGEITLNPTDSIVGTEVKVSGTGFAASKGVTIRFDGDVVGTSPASVTTSSAGSFTDATFIVPASYRGSHTVEAKDASNNSDTATFTTRQSVAITPSSGAAGATVTVSGTGFKDDEDITITFDGDEVSTSPASFTTNSKGSFSATFNVPAYGGGSYEVEASDGTNNDSQTFTTIPATASFSPLEGYVGDEVTVSGTGFQAGQPVTVRLHNENVRTQNTNNDGSFSISFNVPALAAGDYKVIASDGINTEENYFKIKILNRADINPITSDASPGNVGKEVTISGVGFAAGRQVTITYDGVPVATATVNTDGTFLATFSAPVSSGGPHTVIATDGINTKQHTFVMESTPPLAPLQLKPGMDTKAEADARFDWGDVTDDSLPITYTLQIATGANFTVGSIVLEKTRLTQSEYTITEGQKLEPVSQEAPYYWRARAIDGASNESQWSDTRSFYMDGAGLSLAPSSSSSQPLIYILFGIGALGLGILGFWLGRKTAYY